MDCSGARRLWSISCGRSWKGDEVSPGFYDLCTDQARQAIVCSQQEAVDHESEFIGTEHLLLGLLATEGVARRALAELGITHESVQPLAAVAESAHTFTTPRSGNLVFAPEFKKTLEYSLRDALQMGDSAIGTGHLLLGLLREEWNVGAQLMVSLGVEVSDLRTAIVRMISSQTSGTT